MFDWIALVFFLLNKKMDWLSFGITTFNVSDLTVEMRYSTLGEKQQKKILY